MNKKSRTNLRIPGPTPLPVEVLSATSRQMINHRGHEYEQMQKRITENLAYFFQTENDIFLLTSSGMGGLEAAVSNFFSPGDQLIFFTCGEFGNRWAEIAIRFGATVDHVKIPVGKSVDKDTVYQTLEKHDNVAGVFFTHNETSTGVLNGISELAPLVKTHRSKPLLLVDSISALGAVNLPMDDLGIDVLVTASQKAWMAPPGIAMISISPYAWERHATAKMPHYYFDISLYKEFAEKFQTPATPAVTTLFGLDTSLEMMKKEGREKIFQRHIQIMNHLRSGIKKLGLTLFVDDEDASPTVTSITLPENVDGKRWVDLLREKYNIELAGGMGETKGKIIRVAHMGYVSEKDIDGVLDALKKSFVEIK
ncbi:alanine--glyoxylate aminotransferase family protein [Candidatus Gottesmanbacteria bacterium]|nr:alanine--glyoxylate aminotransferase family protein [Candidatus Gottesmanbacteria bacterium]